MIVTRDNLEELLDRGLLCYEFSEEQSVPLVRRGSLKRWRTQPGRFILPVAFGTDGVLGNGAITEMCFWADGRARSMFYTRGE
jgi:hypothetical protein